MQVKISLKQNMHFLLCWFSSAHLIFLLQHFLFPAVPIYFHDSKMLFKASGSCCCIFEAHHQVRPLTWTCLGMHVCLRISSRGAKGRGSLLAAVGPSLHLRHFLWSLPVSRSASLLLLVGYLERKWPRALQRKLIPVIGLLSLLTLFQKWVVLTGRSLTFTYINSR
jgi:hypothetical protein